MAWMSRLYPYLLLVKLITSIFISINIPWTCHEYMNIPWISMNCRFPFLAPLFWSTWLRLEPLDDFEEEDHHDFPMFFKGITTKITIRIRTKRQWASNRVDGDIGEVCELESTKSDSYFVVGYLYIYIYEDIYIYTPIIPYIYIIYYVCGLC